MTDVGSRTRAFEFKFSDLSGLLLWDGPIGWSSTRGFEIDGSTRENVSVDAEGVAGVLNAETCNELAGAAVEGVAMSGALSID